MKKQVEGTEQEEDEVSIHSHLNYFSNAMA